MIAKLLPNIAIAAVLALVTSPARAMYHPGIGQFLQRDPGSDSGRYADGMNRYQYVRSNPVRYFDPSGRDAEEQQQGKSCTIRACVNPVGAGQGHAYLVLTRAVDDKQVEWAYRGGPSNPEGVHESCPNSKALKDTKRGQLITTHAQYNDKFVDYVSPEKENCEKFEVPNADCETLHKRFVEVMRRIDACCIKYEAVPLPGVDSARSCNSNCVVKWILLESFEKVPNIFAGKKAQGMPGWLKPIPDCAKKKKDGDEGCE